MKPIYRYILPVATFVGLKLLFLDNLSWLDLSLFSFLYIAVTANSVLRGKYDELELQCNEREFEIDELKIKLFHKEEIVSNYAKEILELTAEKAGVTIEVEKPKRKPKTK